MKGAYQAFPLDLKLGHAVLRRNIERFIAIGDAEVSPRPADLADFLDLYVDFLDIHHEGEDDFLFPALRRHSKGRSTDVAHLDSWTIEHRPIYAASKALSAAAKQVRSGSPGGLREIQRVSIALKPLLEHHVASEEAVLTSGHLREMISEAALQRVEETMARRRTAGGLEMAAFFVHSLALREQRELLDDVPPLKALADEGRLDIPRFQPFVYERTVALR